MRLITMEVSQSYLDGDICSSFTVLDLPDPRESSDRSRFSLSLSHPLCSSVYESLQRRP